MDVPKKGESGRCGPLAKKTINFTLYLSPEPAHYSPNAFQRNSTL